MAKKTLAELQSMFDTIFNEKRTHANTAERIGGAFLAILPYLGEYLRKDQPETMQYLLTLLQGAVIGSSNQIRLNPDGSIRCGSIYVDGSAIFEELVINKQSVNEGDQIFSNRGIIEVVDQTATNRFRLTFRREYENDRISFEENDCLKCKINNLDTEGTYFTSWFRVQSVDYENNTADVILYPDNEVPGGQNHAPVEGAVVARWGNPVETDRQQHFFLSSTDGIFAFLQNVTKPIINDEGSNVTAFIGLPNDVPAIARLVREGTLRRTDPILYAKTAVIENLITVKHDGSPDYVQREWDFWDDQKQYIKGYDSTEERYVQDNVWHGGSLWRCIVPLATIGAEPSLTNTDWACIRSGGLVLEIESTEGDWFNGDKNFITTLVAMLVHGDLIMSAEDITTISWTRESGDAQSDAAWNINQAKRTQTMNLTVTYDLDHPEQSDIPVNMPYGSKCGFRCTVTGDFSNIPITNIYDIA